MEKGIYAVYDNLAQCYPNDIFIGTCDGLVVRGFTNAVNDEKTDFCKSPEDFVLHKLGEFNAQTGEFNIYDKAEILITGSAAKVIK